MTNQQLKSPVTTQAAESHHEAAPRGCSRSHPTPRSLCFCRMILTTVRRRKSGSKSLWKQRKAGKGERPLSLETENISRGAKLTLTPGRCSASTRDSFLCRTQICRQHSGNKLSVPAPGSQPPRRDLNHPETPARSRKRADPNTGVLGASQGFTLHIPQPSAPFEEGIGENPPMWGLQQGCPRAQRSF